MYKQFEEEFGKEIKEGLTVVNELLSLLNNRKDMTKLGCFLGVTQFYIDVLSRTFEEAKETAPLYFEYAKYLETKIIAFITFLLAGDKLIIKDKDGNIL
jgi:hypothetical protein